MKQYYYSENNDQKGPFTLEELKEKRLKKSTLVWTDGLMDWVRAETIKELKDIVLSEPPPLPGRQPKTPQETVSVKFVPTTSSISTSDYVKETEATLVGAILFVGAVILKLSGVLTFDNEESYHNAQKIGVFISLFICIVGTVWVVGIASRQNRNQTSWGIFAFFFAPLALMIIGLLDKLPLKLEIDSSISLEEQLAILKRKADELKNNQRLNEALSVLLKIKELQSNYQNIDEEIQACTENIKNSKRVLPKNVEILDNKQMLEFEGDFIIGCKVLIDGVKPVDKIIKFQNEQYRYEIKDGCVFKEFFIHKFKQGDGSILEVDENTATGYLRGNRAWINNIPAPDGIYKKGFLSSFKIKDGIVV